MKVISSNLPNKYRLYQTDDGILVRVGVIVKADHDEVSAYRLEAEVTDAEGEPTGPMVSHSSSHAKSQAEMPVVQAGRGDLNKGELAVDGGRLYQCVDDAWIDRGPIPDGADVAIAETLCELDRTARGIAEKARLAWLRQSAASEITSLLDG